MALTAGTRLGPYEILAPIGAGGMGEVYRARDTQLDRDVAIKVLPAALAQDPERLARFEREAKVLASLNHPNIAQIYGIEDRALVMELVPGEPLRGRLPLETALNFAKQIADALEAAHEKNIIHRDLKPANIMITPAGVVKVLDFGLAAVAQLSDPSSPANSPTLTISPTRAGMILGTAGYMAPEQARGKAVDKRADIWAFGVVLFEMLTGKKLFDGETVSDTLAQVLTKEPDWEQVPVKVRRLLQTCLQKDPKQRLQAISDWRHLLTDALTQTIAPLRSRLGWVAATAVFALVAAVLGWMYFSQPPTGTQVLRLQIDPPEAGGFSNGAANTGVALSPDGRTAAYIVRSNGKSQLWVRPLSDTTARLIPGTEGAGFPFWSPDSKSIAFVTGVKLQRVDLAGGAPLTICVSSPIRGGTWTSNDQIIFGTLADGLFRVPASGGTPSPLDLLGSWPQALPNGHFLYSVSNLTSPRAKAEDNGVYAASLAKHSEPVRLLSTDTSALYAPGANGKGYLLWLRGSTLLAQDLDVARLRLVGESYPIADPVAGLLDMVNASVSNNGLLLYLAADPPQQFTWVDRTGKRLATVGEPLELGPFRLSPDGRRVTIARATGAGVDLWLREVERGVTSRFTFTGGTYPAWSPDGRTVLYGRLGPRGLYRKALYGGGAEQSLTQSPNLQVPTDWSRDGRFVLFYEITAKFRELWLLPLTPEGRPEPNDKPRRYAGGQFNTRWGRFSPDNRWVAYESDESGRYDVYVDSFPEPHRKVQISTAGGSLPEWGPDGRELFYVSPDNRLMSASLKVGADSVEPSAPRELLLQLPIWGLDTYSYDIAPDGQRFLIPGPAQQAPEPLTLIVNWPALLKK
jgi:serine/threonine protein kinase